MNEKRENDREDAPRARLFSWGVIRENRAMNFHKFAMASDKNNSMWKDSPRKFDFKQW